MFLVPVVATIYVVYAVFMKIDNLFNFPVPGMGFAITILMITVIGFVGSNFLTRKLVNVVDVIFSRLPIIKMIYTSVKDLIDARIASH